MNNLAQIAIGLFIIANTLFELNNNPESVPFSILYFSALYLTLMLICLDRYLEKKKVFFKYMSIAFATRLIWENTKWGMKFDEYIISVNNYEKSILFAFLTITILTTIIHHAGKNRINSSN